jgi:ribosome maturation factor RimP
LSEPVLIGGALQPLHARVRTVATPIVNGLGLTLVGVELLQEGRRPVLWVYIDRDATNDDEDESDGVTIDDCARVSPELSAALDVDDPLPEAYELRVSSPGLDRPLMSDVDFRRFAGRQVQLQLLSPLEGRRKFTGEVIGTENEQVSLRCADGEHEVPLNAIQRARLRFEVSVGKKAK